MNNEITSVRYIVDDVDVVAASAAERIGPGTTIERVVAVIAGDDVCEGVTGA